MESQNQFEELDDQADTESFDDVMTICPRPGMTLQERYEFDKKNKPSMTKSNQDVLHSKDFNILVDRVNGLEQELEEIKQRKSSLRYIFAACLICLFASSALYWISDLRLRLSITIGNIFLVYICSYLNENFETKERRNKNI